MKADAISVNHLWIIFFEPLPDDKLLNQSDPPITWGEVKKDLIAHFTGYHKPVPTRSRVLLIGSPEWSGPLSDELHPRVKYAGFMTRRDAVNYTKTCRRRRIKEKCPPCP
jgi:hypothetical protein